MDQENTPVPMEIKGLIMDPSSNVPIVILRDSEKARLLPIWIGTAEAHAIALEIEGIRPPRPLTHDLLVGLVEALEAKVERIVVTDLRESTFYAEIHLETKDGPRQVDSRPSDAMALALRASAPILVAEKVLEQASRDHRTEKLKDEELLKKYLEELDEEDLGDYEM